MTALPATLDVTEAAYLSTALLARRGTPLVLDASGVERLGGQCLQILLAARGTWQADAVPFEIHAASLEFSAALATFAADTLMPCQVEETVA